MPWSPIRIASSVFALTVVVAAGCSKQAPPYCEKLQPPASAGKVHEQAAALKGMLEKLGVPKENASHAAFEEALGKVQQSTNRHYTSASAGPLADDLGIAAKAWQRGVAYDCGEKVATSWDAPLASLREAIVREGADNEKNKAAAEAKVVADAKQRDESRNKNLTICRESVVSRLGKKIPLAPTHYSRNGGKRGAIAYFRKKGDLWVGDDPRFLDDEPGAVQTQGDVVFTRETAKCTDMPDDSSGKVVIRKVCGWHSDVVTCDLTSGAVLGSTQIELPAPMELKVRGSLLDSAKRHMGTQLGARLDQLSWR